MKNNVSNKIIFKKTKEINAEISNELVKKDGKTCKQIAYREPWLPVGYL